MLKIALCDDERIFMERMAHLIQLALNSLHESAKVYTYASSTALVASVADGERFDMYFLDIEIPELDGLRTAERIREFQPNAILLFLTSHLEYALDGYELDAFRYVSKLNVEEKLVDVLDKAIQKIHKLDFDALLVQYYSNYTRVLCRDIIYIRKAYRSVQIVTTQQGAIKDNRGIKELFNLIHKPFFVITDRSFLVNLNYVRKLDGYWLEMTNGDQIPISRPMLPKVKEAIISLWGEGVK